MTPVYLPAQKYSCKQSIWDAALPPSKGPCHLLQFALELSKRESLDASQAFTQHLPSWQPLMPTGFCAQCSRHSSTTFQSLLGCRRKTSVTPTAGWPRPQLCPFAGEPPFTAPLLSTLLLFEVFCLLLDRCQLQAQDHGRHYSQPTAPAPPLFQGVASGQDVTRKLPASGRAEGML